MTKQKRTGDSFGTPWNPNCMPGTASTAAAITVKEWMVANKIPGTLRFYGTPAEEGGSGKVYMVRAGMFKDVDAVVSSAAAFAFAVAVDGRRHRRVSAILCSLFAELEGRLRRCRA